MTREKERGKMKKEEGDLIKSTFAKYTHINNKKKNIMMKSNKFYYIHTHIPFLDKIIRKSCRHFN